MNKLAKAFVSLCGLLTVAAATVWLLNTRGDTLLESPLAATSTAERGAYLAQVGNCAGCHTVRGGQPYAGGLAVDTPFGSVYASNLTPDTATGMGGWTRAEFWRAMHHGRSKDGRLLYPAFPYTSYTLVSRDDADALFVYLTSLPAVTQANTAPTLRFPYNSQVVLALWRALYFQPGSYQADASKSIDWNRGAYLTEGLGHCSACHAARNALGATDGLNLAGGLIPVQNWYAPSLVAAQEAGLQSWRLEDIKALFKTGMTAQASVIGPMAEVVLGSTQHWNEADLNAIAVYLKALEPATVTPSKVAPHTAAAPTSPGKSTERGSKLYEQHCAACHGDDGKGVPNAYPALAGNRAVAMPQTANLVQIVLNGGYAPATHGNPRPFGMPPFVLVLNDSDVAEVLTHIRSSWGHQAGSVSAFDVGRVRDNGVK
jgi:mono/diheme cytochrome c family protein